MSRTPNTIMELASAPQSENVAQVFEYYFRADVFNSNPELKRGARCPGTTYFQMGVRGQIQIILWVLGTIKVEHR